MSAPIAKPKRSFNVILMRLTNRFGWAEGQGNTDPFCLNPSWVFCKKNWRAVVYFKQKEILFTRIKEEEIY